MRSTGVTSHKDFYGTTVFPSKDPNPKSADFTSSMLLVRGAFDVEATDRLS